MTFKNITIFSIVIFLMFFNCIKSENIEQIIDKLSCQDREDLEKLFCYFIHQDHFAYTLFGDKPVSISGNFNMTPWENILEIHDSGEVMLKQWHVWEKYFNQFTFKNFILYKEVNELTFKIILINKKFFLKTIEENTDIFENIIGKKIQPEIFLKDIEQHKVSFHESICNSEFLLGLLLGYGKHNALLFCQRGKIATYSCLKPFGDYNYSLIRMDPVHFMADYNHSNTKILQKKYEKQRENISIIFHDGHFLEKTLHQLTSN